MVLLNLTKDNKQRNKICSEFQSFDVQKSSNKQTAIPKRKSLKQFNTLAHCG